MNLFDTIQSATPDYSSLNPVSALGKNPMPESTFSQEALYPGSIAVKRSESGAKISRADLQQMVSNLSRSEAEKKVGELIDMGFEIEGADVSNTKDVEQDQSEAPSRLENAVGIATGIGESAMKRGENVSDILSRDVSGLGKAAGVVGQGIGFIGDVIGEGVIGTAKVIAPESTNEIKKVFQEMAQKPGVSSTIKSIAENWDSFVQEYPEAATWLEAAGNVATGAGITKGASVGAGSIAKNVNKGLMVTGAKDAEKSAFKSALKIAPTDVKKEVSAMERAIQQIDTSKVTTYDDLVGAFSKKKKELVAQVDEITQGYKGPKIKKLERVSEYGDGINAVKSKRDVLKESIDLMKTQAVGDDLAYWTSVGKKAKTSGLSAYEVNDLARRFLSDTGKKMKQFTRSGDATASKIGEQMRELRGSLKEALREKIGDPRFKELDSMYSDLANAQLNAELYAGKTLKEVGSTVEPGVVGSVVSGAVNFADLLTGRNASSIAKQLLRGVGVNVKLSKIEMERALQKNISNLKNAQSAIKLKSNIKGAVKKLKKSPTK